MSKTKELQEDLDAALASITSALNDAEKYNDFGSVMGIREELEQIYQDLTRSALSASIRANRLQRRIKDWENKNLEVPLLTKVSTSEDKN